VGAIIPLRADLSGRSNAQLGMAESGWPPSTEAPRYPGEAQASPAAITNLTQWVGQSCDSNDDMDCEDVIMPTPIKPATTRPTRMILPPRALACRGRDVRLSCVIAAASPIVNSRKARPKS